MRPSINLRTHPLLKTLGRCLRACEGGAGVIMALSTIPLIGGTGLAIDTTRAFVVESRMGKALDAAGLAAGRVALEDRVEADARAFFAANYRDGLMGSDISAEDIDIQIDSNAEFITVTAQTSMPTRFMRVFGKDSINVSARSVIQRVTSGTEIALVMDNTGSMYGSKIDAMKNAAQQLVNIVFGDAERYDELWFSLVPYTATVNVGAEHSGWVNAGPNFSPTSWKGCVEARWQSNRDETDAPPTTERFDVFYYPSTLYDPDGDANGNQWPDVDESVWSRNSGTGPNLGCGPAITPLTRERSEITNAIDAMAAWHRGGTTSNLGLVWGWRTLSPRWRGVWPGSVWPVDYNDEKVSKVAIVLSDGQNQFFDYDGDDDYVSDYTGYGRIGEEFMPSATNEGDGLDTLDGKFADVCQKMKDRGITIYTITFGSGASSGRIRDLFRACASDPGNYFHAPDNDDLAPAFRTIGQELANLRIVE
ncbi:pilus assembly protein TadG-related protein [Rhodovibrio salinarum]|uniref:VWA domain-containing protein n=1 Tax=Rhodovibrio salinarum TaxID=1087 RepID=A0A934QFZ2_9PROT|nr:pilus assembly protein TadG-related protein [Rhodovibrio salinarum]MBK1696286.1 VWA domain-containing protein [Rhodovibrio salinarum]